MLSTLRLGCLSASVSLPTHLHSYVFYRLCCAFIPNHPVLWSDPSEALGLGKLGWVAGPDQGPWAPWLMGTWPLSPPTPTPLSSSFSETRILQGFWHCMQ